MKKVKLKDFFDFLPKSKVQAGNGLENGTYPFYTSSENQTKYLNEYQHTPGCLVFGTGGKASVHLTTTRFSTSTDCIVIKPKVGLEIDAGYVFQYFKGNMRALENGFKGAGLKHISKTYLSDIQIPYLEDINDQRRIASLLGKVEGLIAQRKQHMQQLDDLFKSVFFKMFGPSNPDYLKWPLVEIRDLAAKHKGAMRTGPFGSSLLHSEFTPEGDVAVLGIDNAVQNRFAWDKHRFITKAKYEKLKRYQVFAGDVIVTIMGTIGRSAVIPDDIPAAINTKHLVAITLDREVVNPLFLSYSIHSSPFILRQFISKNRGAIMTGLNLGIIKETKTKLPPIIFQNRFADICADIEHIKSRYQQSLTDLEALYGALSQKAFNGELDLWRVPISKLQVQDIAPTSNEGQTTLLKSMEPIPVIQLPNTVEQLAVLTSSEANDAVSQFDEEIETKHENTILLATHKGRVTLLKHKFENAINNLGVNDTFDIHLFWIGVLSECIEFIDEYSEMFGLAEYEFLKKWIFEKIKSGEMEQRYDEFMGLELCKSVNNS